MSRVLKFVWLCIVWLLCVPVQSVQAASEVESLDDLNKLILDMVMAQETSRSIVLGGTLSARNISGKIRMSICHDYADTGYYSSKNEDDRGILGLKLKPGTCYLAACYQPQMIRKMSGVQRTAFAEFKNRVKSFNIKGLSVAEKVMMVQDDLRARRISDRGARRKSISGTIKADDFTMFLTRNVAADDVCSDYMQMMLNALGIPCRNTDDCRMGTNLVQVENGAWYRLDVNEPGFFVDEKDNSGRSRVSRGNDQYPATPDVCDIVINQHDSVEEFWEAAQEAFKEGEKKYSARIGKYPGEKEFRNSYDTFIAEGGTVEVATMHLIEKRGRKIFTCVEFTQESATSVDKKASGKKKSKGKLKNKFKKLNKE